MTRRADRTDVDPTDAATATDGGTEGDTEETAEDTPVRAPQELPDGFQVQLDMATVVNPASRRHLLGGSPMRLLTLSPAAVDMIDADGRLVISGPASATLGRRLLDAGVAHPRPMFGPDADDVTVVIPVRDNQSGIDRLLRALIGVRVVVVDDGSVTPVVVGDAGCTGGVELIRLDRSVGPAAARNLGARHVETELIAFVDSDVVPESGWLFKLLAHFSDDRVAMVAPRIVAMTPDGGPMARYEALCSSLDMGRRESAVAPGTRVPYVPSAAIILRRSVFREVTEGGFDESLHVAEDVDLCWRITSAGWVIRYDPIAVAAHDHRDRLGPALRRRRFYGTGAALLSDRHPTLAAPIVMTVPMAVAALGVLTRSRWGLGLLVAMVAIIGRRLHGRVSHVPDAFSVAAKLTAQSMGFGFLQFASALCRHYWPLSVVLAVFSARFRQVLLAVALADGLVEWVRSEMLNPDPVQRLGVARFVVLKRLDDLAYGAGLWEGVLAARAGGALRPVIGSVHAAERHAVSGRIVDRRAVTERTAPSHS
ncbi:mycofactocin biosynthesis glycosyltransferase MftF [Williamsia sp. Leaf354]|jgi:mycofactocin system glycosyltransferase|uniref:mycofactocin biosynthesis glycosyltransferase MftF n=1 Tax=Williamsia sp. Leaf354 TaxID=1736349 RepID=UPI000A616D0F|nr:mycofactocin biosynthesis glycosyltransferase MftF [Williamsia sp. Leaf354]